MGRGKYDFGKILKSEVKKSYIKNIKLFRYLNFNKANEKKKKKKSLKYPFFNRILFIRIFYLLKD